MTMQTSGVRPSKLLVRDLANWVKNVQKHSGSTGKYIGQLTRDPVEWAVKQCACRRVMHRMCCGHPAAYTGAA